MKTFIKIIVAIIAVLLIIQIPVFRPKENKSDDNMKNDIGAVYPNMSMHVYMVFYNSCFNCHSNNTDYPWYYKIQPVSWWMSHHVNKGKRHLNFSEFAKYDLKERAHKLHEIAKEMKSHKMPLNSYLWMHKDAKLSDEEYKTIEQWAKQMEDSTIAKISGQMNP